MIKKLIDYFHQSDDAFVLLFGSYASGEETSMSDIDIGIYFSTDVDLKTVGYRNAMLEKEFAQKIDLTVLNNIEKKDPLFAFNILLNHKVLSLKDENSYIHFKTAVQLSYLDHKELIEQNICDLKNRINTHNFSKRNYA